MLYYMADSATTDKPSAVYREVITDEYIEWSLQKES